VAFWASRKKQTVNRIVTTLVGGLPLARDRRRNPVKLAASAFGTSLPIVASAVRADIRVQVAITARVAHQGRS
jgi:hypothetical protein